MSPAVRYYMPEAPILRQPGVCHRAARSWRVWQYNMEPWNCRGRDNRNTDLSGGCNTHCLNITTISPTTAWTRNQVTTGWTTDTQAADYGIWSTVLTIPTAGGGNLTTYYVGNYASTAPPPIAQPQANTFRMFLPTSAGGSPVKPYVTQTLAWRSGPNPPAVGSTTRARLTSTSSIQHPGR